VPRTIKNKNVYAILTQKITGSFAVASFKIVILSIVGVFAQLVNFIFLLKYLGAPEFGQYRVFLSYVGFAGVAHLGYLDGLTQDFLQKKKEPSLIQLFLISLLPALLSFAILSIFPTFQYKTLIGVGVVLANISAFLNVSYTSKRFYYFASYFNLMAQGSLMAVVLILNRQLQTNYAIYALLVSNAVAILIILAVKRNSLHTSLKFNELIEELKGIRPVMVRGMPILLIGLFFVAIYNLDKIIFFPHYDKNVFGRYAYISSVSSVIFGVFSSISNMLLFKFGSSSEEQKERIYFTVKHVLYGMFFVFTLAGIILLFAFKKQSFAFERDLGFILSWVPLVIPACLIQNFIVPFGRIASRQNWLVSNILICFLFQSVSYFVFVKWNIALEFYPLILNILLSVLILFLEKTLLGNKEVRSKLLLTNRQMDATYFIGVVLLLISLKMVL